MKMKTAKKVNDLLSKGLTPEQARENLGLSEGYFRGVLQDLKAAHRLSKIENTNQEIIRKMSEIPEDVMMAAKSALFMCGAVHFPAWGQPSNGKALIENEAIEATAKAILAEREACAKIAEEYASAHEFANDAVKDIIDIIRRR